MEETLVADFKNYIIDLLSKNAVSVVFIKKDGTERTMRCTLKADLLPVHEIKEDKKDRKISVNTIAAYDLDAKGWRSFRVDSIKSINLID